jgi:hypothetical protein
MKKLVAYKTDFKLTANIVTAFSESINKHIKNWQSETLHINEFLKKGIPEYADAILTQGILRGTGHLLKDAARKNIDRYFIDHAYFNPGYKNEFWLRISKNKHIINYVNDVSEFRWNRYFLSSNQILPWKNHSQRGKNILIIPPTSAISWYFNEYEWEKNILSFLRNNLSKDMFHNVKIRHKPHEPIVDKNGKYLGLQENTKIKNIPLEEDLNSASIVIAYNSQVALDATLKGIPVIVNKHNCCYPVSFKLTDLQEGFKNSIFDIEPDRLKLCKWLSYCQFNLNEIKNGLAWKTINNFQN